MDIFFCVKIVNYWRVHNVSHVSPACSLYSVFLTTYEIIKTVNTLYNWCCRSYNGGMSTANKYDAWVKKKRTKIETHHLSWSCQRSHPVGTSTNGKKRKSRLEKKQLFICWHMLKINILQWLLWNPTLSSRHNYILRNISVQSIISPW